MGGVVCTDNRFEIIAAYKKKLIENTNIQSSPEEMAVIDNILFRFWQMGWLPSIPHGRLIDVDALPKGRVEWEDVVNAPESMFIRTDSDTHSPRRCLTGA